MKFSKNEIKEAITLIEESIKSNRMKVMFFPDMSIEDLEKRKKDLEKTLDKFNKGE